jgi:polyvinyl alcohol dehydrogenase (cytochrome)
MMRKPHLRIAAVAAPVVAAWAVLWSVSGQAPAPAPPQAKAKGPRPLGMEDGLTFFQTRCMTCHAHPPVGPGPSANAIRALSPERIHEVLAAPSRPEHDAGLTDAEKRRLAEFTGGYRPLGSAAAGNPQNFPNRCASNPPLSDPSAGPAWNGWGADAANTRSQNAKAAGLTAAQVPNLKLKWAFGFPTGVSAFSQPAIAGGRVFVGSDIGHVYSLDARTGCVYWSYETGITVRPAVSVGPVKGRGATRYAVYFGDAKANVYAVDAHNGQLLWKKRVDDHFLARITAAPKLHNGRLYVPVSNSEEWQGGHPDYQCCTARGSVVALDANNGEQVWKAWVMEEPRPRGKNSRGVQLYAPAGGSVWNSPTVDPARNAVYFGTGDSETEPASKNGDAIMAVDMDSGKTLWVYQAIENDAFMGGCFGANKSENCPKVQGPDADIGNSPVLRSLPGGKRVLIAGTKDGDLFALDPDANGKLLWRVKANAGTGGGRGGIVWGGAADEQNAYYGFLSGGMAALKLASGERVWFTPVSGEGARTGHGAAATVIPGVVFAAGSDGRLTALAAADGRKLWEFETAREFQTVNAVKANGGSIRSAGAVVAGGMVFIGSGYGVTGGDRTGNVLLAFGL